MNIQTTGRKFLAVSISLSLLGASFTSCDTYKKQSNSAKGAEIGVGSGAVAGGILGRSLGNTALGAILGAAVGGTAGVLVGKRMDKQAAELKNTVPNATVQRVGEGIDVKFDSGILFDIDKSAIKQEARTNLDNFAQSLQRNPDTKIQVNGYTDNTGSPAYNLTLSERRADAVKLHLMNAGIDASRMEIVGYGETHPAADNNSVSGRSQNRRVEILITANEKMKQEAKQAASSNGGGH